MSELREFCNLSEEDLKERRARLSQELFPLARGREELADGLALRFDATPKIRQALDDFVAFERECCPGLDFSLHDAAGALRLEIHGIDPKANVFAGIGEEGSPAPPAALSSDVSGARGARGWLKLLRSTGVGAIGAFVLFCVAPMALVALLGAQFTASLAGLENPWTLGIGTLVFGGLFWRWERRRAAIRAQRASAGNCGC